MSECEQKGKKLSLSSGRGCGCTLEELANCASSEGQLVPAFVRACVEYIEQEGLRAEGLYRVPGNRAHVDQLVETLRLGNVTLHSLLLSAAAYLSFICILVGKKTKN